MIDLNKPGLYDENENLIIPFESFDHIFNKINTEGRTQYLNSTLVLPKILIGYEELDELKYVKTIHAEKVNCTNLRCMDLPDLEIIYLPDNFSYFDRLTTFSGCQYLKEIHIKDTNPFFKTIDGVLYNKNLEDLVYCPPISEAKLQPVKDIGPYALCWSAKKKLVLNDGLNHIGEHAFAISDIEVLYVPDSIKTISSSAFDEMENLKTAIIPKHLFDSMNFDEMLLNKDLFLPYASIDELIDSYTITEANSIFFETQSKIGELMGDNER